MESTLPEAPPGEAWRLGVAGAIGVCLGAAELALKHPKPFYSDTLSVTFVVGSVWALAAKRGKRRDRFLTASCLWVVAWSSAAVSYSVGALTRGTVVPGRDIARIVLGLIAASLVSAFRLLGHRMYRQDMMLPEQVEEKLVALGPTWSDTRRVTLVLTDGSQRPNSLVLRNRYLARKRGGKVVAADVVDVLTP